MKISDGDLLNVGTEITIDTAAKTFTLLAAGNLVAKDGVTLQALYSKFIKLWETAAYNKYPFPMYTIDAKSGQFQFGTDGGSFNGWKPATDATRQMLRDGGWSEYSAAGVLNRQYVGIVSLGEVNAGAQLYYQRNAADAPINFTFSDEVNEGIQVFGDLTNGNFDKRNYFQAFVREYQKKYKASTLNDTGQSATGAFTVNVLLSNEDDLKITANDAVVGADAPYTGITVEFFGANQNKTIGAGSYPFRKIIDGNNATLEQIYTKIQYLLRQDSDIDSGSGTVNGKTASELCYFVGDTLYTTTGVFIENILDADLNRIVFVDQNGVQRTYPYASAGVLNFNSFLAQGGIGYFRMYFTNDDAGSNNGYDYATANAITVNDKDGAPIAGAISGAQIGFTYDYDGNTQRGAGSEGEDAPITVVAGNKGVAKPVVATGTISRSKGISVSLVAEQDRAYVD
jgi:hypothetical protein